MNEQPHAHKPEVYDHGHWWRVRYGDQEVRLGRPRRWRWESDQTYLTKCQKRIPSSIRRIVRRHDRQTKLASVLSQVPTFRPDAWGSEQL